MSAFDPAAFDFRAFDVGPVSPDVYGARSIAWRAVVILGGVDVSDFLSGQLKVTGGESAARTAEFYVTPMSDAEVSALAGASVTIDYVIVGNGTTLTERRFTGSVADWDFDPSSQLASIIARDAYQETINACATRDDVLALLGSAAVRCDAIADWSDATPDPSAYFSQLAATAHGAYGINASGAWQFTPWVIGTPAAIFRDGDIFDESFTLVGSSKSDLPASISASLTARVNRLCAVDVPLVWAGLDYLIVGRERGAWPSVQTVMSALEGLHGWHIKGVPTMTHPQSSYVITTMGGGTAAMIVAQPEQICIGFAVTMHHRWYQTVDLTWTIDIPLGGMSDRDKSIADSITSEFDVGAWEDASSSTSSTGIYAVNPPPSSAESSGETSGYEGLPVPHPGINRAILHFPDIGLTGLQAAGEFVVAKAVRAAADGLRQRRIELLRPLDPRWDIGAVISGRVGGVYALGQITDIEDVLDHDSGDATTKFTVAVPDGNASAQGWSAVLTPPDDIDMVPPTSPILSNFVGADTETSTTITDDALLGFLSNTSGAVSQYSPTKPAYVPQFRIVMPEIPAPLRDPTTVAVDMAATWAISKGILEVDF